MCLLPEGKLAAIGRLECRARKHSGWMFRLDVRVGTRPLPSRRGQTTPTRARHPIRAERYFHCEVFLKQNPFIYQIGLVINDVRPHEHQHSITSS
jgi:hypothetical protein